MEQARITRWTERTLGFTPRYSEMEHPLQRDTVICGVATINTMERFLVDTTAIMGPNEQVDF
jgi:hypothetical protein